MKDGMNKIHVLCSPLCSLLRLEEICCSAQAYDSYVSVSYHHIEVGRPAVRREKNLFLRMFLSSFEPRLCLSIRFALGNCLMDERIFFTCTTLRFFLYLQQVQFKAARRLNFFQPSDGLSIMERRIS